MPCAEAGLPEGGDASSFTLRDSIKYRFAKICELLDADLRDHELRLAVEIALKLHMVNNHRYM
ncbi:MAG: helix-turn-helix domain-containing protein [Synergistaceae bacterium]|nr:helix-turn-helix domain-containing protein [Synergistaceae bacterium]